MWLPVLDPANPSRLIIQRISPVSGRVVGKVVVRIVGSGGGYLGLTPHVAVGQGGIWIVDAGAGQVVVVDESRTSSKQ